MILRAECACRVMPKNHLIIWIQTKRKQNLNLSYVQVQALDFQFLPSKHTSLIVDKRYIKVQSATTKNLSNTCKEGIN